MPSFFKRLVVKKNDKEKSKFISETDEKYISKSSACIRLIDSYQLLSSSLDKLVKTLVDISHKTLKDLKQESVDNDETFSFVEETGEEYGTNEDLRKHIPDEF